MSGGHLALNEPDNGRENRTRNSAAYCLAYQGAEVNCTSGARQRRDHCRKKLAASNTADRAR